MKLYVGNLSYSTTDDDLNAMFAPFGDVTSAKVISDRYTGQSRGFGFVEMADRAAGQKAMEELHGKKIDNRDLVVNEAKPQEKKTSSRW
ncbi:MAG: RNA-binding protein [Deltaproteobacteria bacterium CG_4_10_14_3_um_filter_60_8]|nr:MAG: RNA-binding protein [Desulfobacterales bacterium CG2_30_60_27]PIY23203.1 MAG: RNA-binding protein [Deltaproteobacteria bacterium CG_4_10_14_3_um_filter_60_8]